MREQLDLGIGPRNIRMELSDLEREIKELSQKIVTAERNGQIVESDKERLEALRVEHVSLEQELIASRSSASLPS